MKRCKSCHYRRVMFGYPHDPACHFAVDEGELRGCDPEDCFRYRPKKKWRRGGFAEQIADEILQK